MYHRIVVGTDGSSTADRAVEVAGELAALMGASLHIVAAYKPIRAAAALAGVGGPPATWSGDDDRIAADRVLENATARLSAAEFPMGTIARLGDAADVLLAVAEEVDADLIVIGNRGLTGVRRYLLGGVADRVVHHAPCGVHVVHAC